MRLARPAVNVSPMVTKAEPRDAEQRKQDVLERLAEDEDAWVATASPDGKPHMVPLSFVFHEGSLLMCTKTKSQTAHNVRAGTNATIGVGPTRDVILIVADAELLSDAELTRAEGDAFAAKLDWDPRGGTDWIFLRFRPRTLRAWREENELAGRLLLRDGAWLV